MITNQKLYRLAMVLGVIVLALVVLDMLDAVAYTQSWPLGLLLLVVALVFVLR